uniref:conjugal transfer protein TraD n=1 Tax=Kingella oralis TaxID=505 RepID=UPI0034E3C020
AEKAAEATRAARKLVSEKNEKARKERTRNMINAAGLMGLAGLLDKKTGRPLTSPALLLGALVELANRNPTDLEKQSWEQSGAALLAKAKADKD